MKKKKVEKKMTIGQVRQEYKMDDSRWRKLSSEDNKILCLIALLDRVQEIDEKVQRQAEILVRMNFYNPERTQEAHC